MRNGGKGEPDLQSEAEQVSLLVNRCRMGNQRACTDLYDQYKEGVYGYLVRAVTNRADADELLNDVFLDFFRIIRNGESITSIKGLLFTIARRKVADYWRVKYSRPMELSLSEAEAEVSVAGPEAQDQSGGTNKLCKLVSDVYNALSDSDQELLRLYAEGYTSEDIARFLNCKAGTVRAKISRLKKVFAERLQERM